MIVDGSSTQVAHGETETPPGVVGEEPDRALADIDGLDAVQAARAAGLQVDVRVPTCEGTTWRGYRPANPQVYMGWATPADHTAITTAQHVYDSVVAPNIGPPGDGAAASGGLRPAPRVDRWIFSTDGVGYPIAADDDSIDEPATKEWVAAGAFKHPAMFGFGLVGSRTTLEVDLTHLVPADASGCGDRPDRVNRQGPGSSRVHPSTSNPVPPRTTSSITSRRRARAIGSIPSRCDRDCVSVRPREGATCRSSTRFSQRTGACARSPSSGLPNWR